MMCNACAALNDITDLSRPYVVRTCEECGRKIKLRPTGPHGLGIRLEKGDRFVMPAEFLTASANPLKSNMQFSSYGLKWFAESVFRIDLAKREYRDDFLTALASIMESNDGFFEGADCLKGLDLSDPRNEAEAFNRINANPKSTEWFGYMAAGFCSMVRTAIEAGDASQAAWAMAVAERFRALAIYKTNFEEAVLMGNSAQRLVSLLQTWTANQQNSDEGFWQIVLTEHAYAISQLFSVPVTFLQGKAYVGGMSIDGKDARFLDFMFLGGSANDAILVEIKTPTEKLLGAKYRSNVYPPSKALGGAVVQVNDYCHTLRQNVIRSNRSDIDLSTFNPRRVVIIGNYARELTDERRRRSFELFRTGLAGVDILTFDEFFKKIEQLARLFNLVRRNPTG